MKKAQKIELTILLIAVLSILAIFGIYGKAWPAENPAEKLIAKSWELYRQTGNEKEQVAIAMDYYDGRKEEKALTRWTLYDKSSKDKTTTVFSKPAADNGLGMLIWRNQSGDEQWLKLPSLTNVRKISVSDQGKYFGGTDITFEDARQLIGERVKDFNYRLSKDRGEIKTIEALPKPGIETAYGKRMIDINSKLSIVKIDFFDKNGQLIKTLTNENITVNKNGLWRADKMIIDNKLLKRKTLMTITDRQLNGKLPANVFTKDFLNSERR